MWSPTHIQVTVQRAKGLLIKGKNTTNNCFVTIGLGKEKYQTSVKDKSSENVEWHEECELSIPNQGNRAELTLTCLHRNSLGIDEFLGQTTLPLSDMDVYERPRSRWFKLQSKPGKEKKKERGELEIRVAFTVKAGSLSDLSKKEKNKTSKSSNVGGSLLSLGALEKRKGLKNFAKSLGSRMHISGKSKKDKNLGDNDSINDSMSSIGTPTSGYMSRNSRQTVDDADPGVISEDDDEFAFENLSHKSSGSSLNIRSYSSNVTAVASHDNEPSNHFINEEKKSMTLPTPAKPPRNTGVNDSPKVDEWEAKLYGIGSNDSLKRRSWNSSGSALAVQKEEDEKELEMIPASNTAPTTPNLEVKSAGSPIFEDSKPKPIPRSSTLESIVEKEKEEKPEKEKGNIFTKKLKQFRKSDYKTGSNEDLKSNRKQFGERIIIGHENDNKRSSEVPNEIARKYEGKSKEEVMIIAYNAEMEIGRQNKKMKELENYLDELLLKVMETHPRILQTPYSKGIKKR